jgi:GTP-binding protein
LNDPRPTHITRRQNYLDRMDAKAAARAELEAEREAGIWNDDEGFAVSKAAEGENSGEVQGESGE